MDWETYYSQNHDLSNTAYKLWVYYYVTTERFDRNLPFVTKSKYEPDVVVPYGSSIHYSNQFATRVRKIIYDIAKLYEITDKQMQNEKTNISRLKQSYIEQELSKRYNEFEFIFEYMNERGIEL